MDINYALLGILQQHAPNSEAQQKCAELYNQMFADGATTAEIEKHLIGILHVGLTTGNWPWNEGKREFRLDR